MPHADIFIWTKRGQAMNVGRRPNSDDKYWQEVARARRMPNKINIVVDDCFALAGHAHGRL